MQDLCADHRFLFIYFWLFLFFLTLKHPYIKGISSTKMEISTNSLSTYAAYSSTVDHSEVSQRESTQLEGHLQEPNRRKANWTEKPWNFQLFNMSCCVISTPTNTQGMKSNLSVSSFFRNAEMSRLDFAQLDYLPDYHRAFADFFFFLNVGEASLHES